MRALVISLICTTILGAVEAQGQTLQGNVQENVTLPADVFESDPGACDWNTGACDMLHGYLSQGGRDETCRDTLEQAVKLEGQERALGQTSPQYGHDPALDRQMGELEQRRDAILHALPPDCFAAGPSEPSDTAPIRVIDSPTYPTPLRIVLGLRTGFDDCVNGIFQGVQNTAAAALFMMSGDFVSAAETLGLEPGQSVVLRTIWNQVQQEASEQTVGASPFEWGRRVARRFCQYAVIPAIAKAVHQPGNATAGEILEDLGSRPTTPLVGQAIAEQWTGLTGKYVKLGGTTYEVGPLRFKGAFASAYEVQGQPGKLLKIPRPDEAGANAMRGQLAGADKLSGTGIPTPEIYDSSPGTATNPPFMLVEDIGAKNVLLSLDEMTEPMREASRAVFQTLADHALLWGDGASRNMYVADAAGGRLRVGILDPDMIFKADEFRAQPNLTKELITKPLIARGQQGLLFQTPLDASAIMNELFEYQFPRRLPAASVNP